MKRSRNCFKYKLNSILNLRRKNNFNSNGKLLFKKLECACVQQTHLPRTPMCIYNTSVCVYVYIYIYIYIYMISCAMLAATPQL